MVIVNATLFLSSCAMKYFYLRNVTDSFNEIETNIVNCRMFLLVSLSEKSSEKKLKIKTQNENIVEKNIDRWYLTYKNS